MYPSDTTIEFVGLEEKLAMGRIVKPQSAADMGNVALTDDLFEGIHELLFALLSRLPSGLEMAMLQSLFQMVEQLEKMTYSKSFPKERTFKRRLKIGYKENARAVQNPIFSSLKPVKL
jgi:hypothetical protein